MKEHLRLISIVTLLTLALSLTGCQYLPQNLMGGGGGGEHDELIPLSTSIDMAYAMKKTPFLEGKIKELEALAGETTVPAEVINEFDHMVGLMDVKEYSPEGLMKKDPVCFTQLIGAKGKEEKLPIPLFSCEVEDEKAVEAVKDHLKKENLLFFAQANLKEGRTGIEKVINEQKSKLAEELSAGIEKDIRAGNAAPEVFKNLGFKGELGSEEFIDEVMAKVGSINGVQLLTHANRYQMSVYATDEEVSIKKVIEMEEGVDVVKMGEILNAHAVASQAALTSTTDAVISHEVKGNTIHASVTLKNYDYSALLYFYIQSSEVLIGTMGQFAVIQTVMSARFMNELPAIDGMANEGFSVPGSGNTEMFLEDDMNSNSPGGFFGSGTNVPTAVLEATDGSESSSSGRSFFKEQTGPEPTLDEAPESNTKEDALSDYY